MATGVHLLMVISGFVGGNRRELWELVFLVVTSIAYLLWRFGRGSPAAHLSRSRLICNILSLLACLRWLAIWAVPDPETAFINVVSGLLYLPLLLGCLILLGESRASIHGLIGFFLTHAAVAGSTGRHPRDAFLGLASRPKHRRGLHRVQATVDVRSQLEDAHARSRC